MAPRPYQAHPLGSPIQNRLTQDLWPPTRQPGGPGVMAGRRTCPPQPGVRRVLAGSSACRWLTADRAATRLSRADSPVLARDCEPRTSRRPGVRDRLFPDIWVGGLGGVSQQESGTSPAPKGGMPIKLDGTISLFTALAISSQTKTTCFQMDIK